MDDTRTQVEFPIGTTGKYVKVNEPTDAQRLVLALSRAPSGDNPKAQVSLVQRLFRVLEKLTGEQWLSVIEDGLIDEEFTVQDVVGVIEQVVKFDWAGTHKPQEAEPQPMPAAVEHINGVLQMAADLEQEMERDEKPLPRVVGA